MGQGDAAIGLGNDVAQQVALREGLGAAILGVRAVSKVPEGIVTEPVLIYLIGGEDAVEREVVAQFGTLHIAGQGEQLVGQVGSLDMGRVVAVVKEYTHEMAVILMALAETV